MENTKKSKFKVGDTVKCKHWKSETFYTGIIEDIDKNIVGVRVNEFTYIGAYIENTYHLTKLDKVLK